MDRDNKSLQKAVTNLVVDLHPDKISQLASLIKKNSENIESQIIAWATKFSSKSKMDDLLNAWLSLDISPDEVAGMLNGASYAYHKAKLEQSIELVWTGPATGLVPTRKTEQALLEVINTASDELFLTSYVAYKVELIMDALKRALVRGVGISILLESSDEYGGSITLDAIKNMQKYLPKSQIYYWSKKEDIFIDGKVHAKVVVADEKICFISSANLTGYAMEKNMEAGILIQGGETPRQLHQYLKALITTGVINCTTQNQ
jgi:cardiolipin synthase A/B